MNADIKWAVRIAFWTVLVVLLVLTVLALVLPEPTAWSPGDLPAEGVGR